MTRKKFYINTSWIVNKKQPQRSLVKTFFLSGKMEVGTKMVSYGLTIIAFLDCIP
jgi:hypothetical protein